MRRVYLDHSATTPVRPEVARVVQEYMTEKYGNPSSLHSYGKEAKNALDRARLQAAAAINASPAEIIFTSGGTESDNLAICGVALQYAAQGKHIITSAVEHHAVLDACESLKEQGFQTTILPVDEYGAVSPEAVAQAITPKTILISIMHANNEVGTIQPVAEIGELAKERGILFHVDAVQSLGKIPVDVEKIKADLLSGSGHKLYGPKGTGFLYLRKGIRLKPLVFGGGQEGNIRPGTENLPGIVGLGLALELAVKDIEEMKRLTTLRDKLIAGLLARIPLARLNGHPTNRIPVNVNMSFAYTEGEALLSSLDREGIAASGASACSSGSTSHVLLAMGASPKYAQAAVRMTLGRDNSEEDIDYVLDKLPVIVEKLRAKSPYYTNPAEAKECDECT